MMILGILQARVSSTRLPGKVLKPLLGQPMLLRQIERIQRAKKIDQLIVATSQDTSDDPLAQICQKNDISYYRGSLKDVLDRFYKIAVQYQPEHIVRLTGDCPLIDPEIIDLVIETHCQGDYDYTSNTIEPTYPDGLDVEIFTYETLRTAWEKANTTAQREHVTLYIHRQPKVFRLGCVKNCVDLSDLRWTVDEKMDFMVVEEIYKQLYPANPQFTTADILNFYKQNKKLKMLNQQYKRNEGLTKSLLQDQLIESQ